MSRTHDWAPRRPKVPREILHAAIADTSRTCREVAAALGYSENWIATLAPMLGIARKRGGDRRSAAARERFGNGAQA